VKRSTSARTENAEKMRAKEGPELPAWKAFVVQFTRDTNPPAGNFSGRVEHLSSGRRARFSSKRELLAGLEKLLEEIGADQSSQRG
jgi:hypothetical protein